jgi:AcrR family transcriptional regulator
MGVATNLFASRGFRGTSIRGIARAMDMSISNIYHYFGNKEGLLLEILKHASAILIERLHKVGEKDMEPMDRFRLLIHSHLCFSMEYVGASKIFSLDDEQLKPEGREINFKIQREIFNIYKRQINISASLRSSSCQEVLGYGIHVPLDRRPSDLS